MQVWRDEVEMAKDVQGFDFVNYYLRFSGVPFTLKRWSRVSKALAHGVV